MKDVRIQAPIAEFFTGKNPTQAELAAALEPPSPQEIISAQDVEIRRLQTELYKLRVTAGTIANTTVAIAHMLLEERGVPGAREVKIPRQLRNRLDGQQISVRSDADGNTYVSYVESPEPVWDGRVDV